MPLDEYACGIVGPECSSQPKESPTDTKMKVMIEGNLVATLVVLTHQHCYTVGEAVGTAPVASDGFGCLVIQIIRIRIR
jgi:hypothetical protein